jgi:hypothetical protein
MPQEPGPDVRERDDVERERVPVERERDAAGFLAADDFDAVDLAAVDRDEDDFAAVDRERVAAGLEAVDFVAAGFDAADFEAVDREAAVERAGVLGRSTGRSRLATRRASDSTSLRSLPSSSNTPCCSSDSRTRVTARATSSTSCVPRSFEPSGSARSTALRTASTVSAAPEPFLVSFFFFASFLAMARV